MIWHQNMFSKDEPPFFSVLGISPDMENEYRFFEAVEIEPIFSLKYWLTYYRKQGIEFKPHFLKAVEQKIRKGKFKNPLKFPDYFDNEFDFISMAFLFGNSPKEIVCDLGLAFIKNGELVYWTKFCILPPEEEDALIFPNKRTAYLHEVKWAHNFKVLWDNKLSKILNSNLLVIYDSVVELSILKTLLLNYGITDFKIWYADVLSLVELSGNSEKLAELGRESKIIARQNFEADEDAVTCANFYQELCKVYPDFRKHVRYLDLGKG